MPTKWNIVFIVALLILIASVGIFCYIYSIPEDPMCAGGEQVNLKKRGSYITFANERYYWVQRKSTTKWEAHNFGQDWVDDYFTSDPDVEPRVENDIHIKETLYVYKSEFGSVFMKNDSFRMTYHYSHVIYRCGKNKFSIWSAKDWDDLIEKQIVFQTVPTVTPTAIATFP